jgi:hypothetical protein
MKNFHLLCTALFLQSLMLLSVCDSAYAATPQPKPFTPSQTKMSQAFASLKQYDEQGDALRIAREDWLVATQLVNTNAEWQAWLKTKQIAMDKWISVPRDRQDMLAGNMFKLLDPVTKMPVNFYLEMPEPARNGVNGDDYWRAWVTRIRAHNLSRIQEAARLYRLTANVKYRDWAIQQLDFYSMHYMDWPSQNWNGKARMMGQSLDEAAAVVTLIDAVRLLSDDVSLQRRQTWQSKLFMPIAQNLLDFNQGVNNIALWHACAIAMIALEYDDALLLERALNGDRGLNALLRQGVNADYLWYEGSFSYNNYVISAMMPLFIQSGLKAKSALLRSPMLLSQNMLLSPLQFRFDDGYLPTVGDTRGRSQAVDLNAFLNVARVMPTSIGVMEAQRIKNWDTLLDRAVSTSTLPVSLPVVTTGLFEASGVAILKNTSWQAFVHYAQATFAHAQAEVPSYELYAGATPISIDQGTVDYASPWHEYYFRRAVAHNVPLIDGEGQELDKEKWLVGQLSQFNASAPAITVHQNGYRAGVDVTRQIKLLDQIFVDQTHITLSANKEARRLGSVFNTDCRLTIDDPAISGFKSASAPLGTGFSYWTEVQVANAPAKWTASLLCGRESFNAQFIVNKPHLVYRASAPATPLPKRRDAIYLELSGHEADFEIRITPQGKL